MKAERETHRQKDSFWRRWGAVLLLFIFFFVSWGGQFVAQLEVARQESEQHSQQFQMNEFWPEFMGSTFENWQSEWLQLVTQALLIVAFADYFFRKGNEETYRTQAMIKELHEEMRASTRRVKRS